MLLTLLKYGFVTLFVAALLRVYFRYDLSAHWVAAKKSLFLWIISTSPVIFAALLSRPPVGQGGAPAEPLEQFGNTVYASFSLGEQFAYAAAFIAPVMYIYIEAIAIAINPDTSDKFNEIRKRLRGYGMLLLPTLCLLVLVVSIFASSKSETDFQRTYLYLFLENSSLAIYLLALGLWYAANLLTTVPNMDFAEQARGETRKFTQAFKERLSRGPKE